MPASYPDVSLLMKMCAQRKAGRRQRARRLADLVFKMAARAMADEYAVFKISSALFILRILSKSLPIHVVCMKRKLFSPQPRSQSSSAISDVTSPVKLVGKVRLGRLANNGKSKMAAPSQECDFSQNS